MKRALFITIGTMLAAAAALSCGSNNNGVAATTAPTASTTTSTTTTPNLSSDVHTQGSIRSITLPELQPELPAGDGQKLVLIACASCHTPQYIMHQPPLSREAWTTSVNKMRTTYSAPIKEENVKPIVDYLVAVRGPQSN